MFDLLKSVRPVNRDQTGMFRQGSDLFTDAMDKYGERVRENAENTALQELMGNAIDKGESGMNYRNRLFGEVNPVYDADGNLTSGNPDIDVGSALKTIGLMSDPHIKQGNEDRDFGLAQRRVGIAGGHLGVAKSRLAETRRHNKEMEEKLPVSIREAMNSGFVDDNGEVTKETYIEFLKANRKEDEVDTPEEIDIAAVKKEKAAADLIKKNLDIEKSKVDMQKSKNAVRKSAIESMPDDMYDIFQKQSLSERNDIIEAINAGKDVKIKDNGMFSADTIVWEE